MNQVNQTVLGIVGGIILIMLVAGAGYYFEQNAKSPAAAPATAQTYDTSGMQTLLTSAGLINRLVGLQPVPQSEAQATQVSSSDIGRTDITKNE